MHNKILIVLIIIMGACFGQDHQPGDGVRPDRNMDAIRIWKLTEALELTEEQTLTFLPLVQIHEREIREATKEMRVLVSKSAMLLKEGKISQKEVDKMIKAYTSKQDEISKIKLDFLKSLSKYLTPKQQLLYVGFEARFRSELREYMKQDRKLNRDKMKREKRP